MTGEDGVVVYVAGWSPACSTVADRVHRAVGGTAEVRVVDVDDEPAAADRAEVWTVPTVLRHEAGQETVRLVGTDTLTRLTALTAP